MKKLFLLLIFSSLVIAASAQAPQGFNYQAVARNTSGSALTNQAVGLQISLLQGSATGTAVYTETHSVTSNNIGLLNLTVGNGIPVTGTFPGIDWSAGPYFIEISMDVTGGTSYVLMGTQQLMSVPYALYAANAGGTAGATGITGATGNNGMDGATGLTGSTGVAGATGATGNDGTNGADGATGNNGINGVTGATGNAGIAGITGATGNNGTNGNTGATGSTGLTGTNGATGATGNNGINGATGNTGIAGATGATGNTGVAGSTGATGFLGAGAATGNTPYWNGSSWVTSSSSIYNDGTNVTIGGPVNPSYPFLIYNNNSNAAFGVNSNRVMIGDVNGTALGNYFYTDFELFPRFVFMGGYIGIGTAAPLEALDIASGNVRIPAANDYKYASAKTQYYSVPAFAFQVEGATYSRSVIVGNIYLGSGSAVSVGYLDAPVSLPDGAIVTSVTFSVVDNDGTYNTQPGQLWRNDASISTSYGNTVLMASTPLPASTNSTLVQTCTTSSISNPVIDNQNYTYFLRWGTQQANTNLRLVKVLISYTVTKAD